MLERHDGHVPPLDPDQCYVAVQSRDQRFDGWFVTAVRTTGIYCRPSCPAITPKRTNVEFHPTAAAAQQRGFRACKRCRPDASPGSPEWNVRQDVVARAMRLIADGVVERDGVGGVARRLGYSERHLNRVFTDELGAGPLAVARAQRAHTARLLVETTALPFTDVAFAAGFGSVRQFNDTIRDVFATSPSELRGGSTLAVDGDDGDGRGPCRGHRAARRSCAVLIERGDVVHRRACHPGCRGMGRRDVSPFARPARWRRSHRARRARRPRRRSHRAVVVERPRRCRPTHPPSARPRQRPGRRGRRARIRHCARPARHGGARPAGASQCRSVRNGDSRR